MNDLKRLHSKVRQLFPDARVSIHSPLRGDGIWAMDIDYGVQRLAVEWSETSRFAVSSISADNFGERPDEIFPDFLRAEQRVLELLQSGEQTDRCGPISLARLRERRGITQQQLARRLKIKQASVSSFEKRSDIQYGTLCRYVEGLEGKVATFAVFGKTSYRIAVSETEVAVEADMSSCHPDAASRVSRTQGAATCKAYEFRSLSETGALSKAESIAERITARGSILEMA